MYVNMSTHFVFLMYACPLLSIFSTAAGNREDMVEFYSDMDYKMKEWGGTVVNNTLTAKLAKGKVSVYDFYSP